MKKLISIILVALSTGCCFAGCVVEKQEVNRVCSVTDTDYKRTDFDCKTYSIEYVFCDITENIDRADCIDPYNAPESHLTHCDAYNICEGK